MPIEQAPTIPADIDVTTLSVPVVMPGLWECHGHFIGILTANLEEFARTPVNMAAARCVKVAKEVLRRGKPKFPTTSRIIIETGAELIPT